MASRRAATVNKFVEAFGTLDLDALHALVSPDFIYTFAPSSAPLPPPMDFETWVTRMGGVCALLKAYPITVTTLIDCGDAENKVVIHATAQAQFKDEVKDDGMTKEEWVNNGEYIVIFTMNADAKLDAVLEFTDSKAVDRFVGLMQKAGGNMRKKMGKPS
jgi:ketosteroid isomerase-like protein